MQRIREFTRQLGLTHAELGALLGLGRSATRDRLYGRTRWTVEDLRTLSEHTGVPMDVLAADVPGRSQSGDGTGQAQEAVA